MQAKSGKKFWPLCWFICSNSEIVLVPALCIVFFNALLQILEIGCGHWANWAERHQINTTQSVLKFKISPEDDTITGFCAGHARKVFDPESLLDRNEHTMTMEGDEGVRPVTMLTSNRFHSTTENRSRAHKKST